MRCVVASCIVDRLVTQLVVQLRVLPGRDAVVVRNVVLRRTVLSAMVQLNVTLRMLDGPQTEAKGIIVGSDDRGSGQYNRSNRS